MDINESMMVAQKASTLQAAQFSIMKKQHEMEMSVVDMIDKVVHSAPPPGQGTRVDTTA